MEFIDYAIIAFGGIICLAAIPVAYFAGKRQRKSSQQNMDDLDWISLRGLSQTSRDLVKNYVKSRHVWEDHRNPKFKRVHID